MDAPRTALVLLNLGGPLRLQDVEPFLLELFTDRDLIRLGPAWCQPLLARLVVRARLREVRTRYAEIGGGSPLLRETAAQAAALRQALDGAGRVEPVRIAFRYAAPRARGVVRALAMQGVRRLLPVSLYPHACGATTGASLGELAREARSFGLEMLPGVLDYATDPDYLACLEARLRETLAIAPEASVVLSAHGLPLSRIRGGDPYEREIQATAAALAERFRGLPGGFRLAYQSRVGPARWLGPSLGQVLAELSGHDVVVLPLSFTSEHLETLHELDIQYRETARRAGVRGYHRVPAPGTHPAFIRCLARLALADLERS